MKLTTTLVLLGAAAAMTACGGGGGGGSDAGSSPSGATPATPVVTPVAPPPGGTPTDPVAAPGGGTGAEQPAPGSGTGTNAGADTAPVTEVPTPTYTAGSIVAAAFDTVNSERSRCGFGKVAQNAQLDAAAGGHAAYLGARWNEALFDTGAVQDTSRSGFTGVNPADRAARAGYTGNVSEYLGYHYYSRPKDYGNALVRTMFASVYHQIGLLDGNRDAGAGVELAQNTPLPMTILTWMTGTQPGVPLQEPATLVTYPCEGSTGLQPYMYGESPDPFAGLGLAQDTHVGHPIHVRAPGGQVLQLTRARVLSAAGAELPVALYHASDDPNRRLGVHQAFVVPRVKLAEGASYTVEVEGTAGGVAFSRRFSFSTLVF